MPVAVQKQVIAGYAEFVAPRQQVSLVQALPRGAAHHVPVRDDTEKGYAKLSESRGAELRRAGEDAVHQPLAFARPCCILGTPGLRRIHKPVGSSGAEITSDRKVAEAVAPREAA
jgi:hypothetical protein